MFKQYLKATVALLAVVTFQMIISSTKLRSIFIEYYYGFHSVWPHPSFFRPL